MAFHHWTSIAAQILGAVTFLAVPMLTLLAFRGRAKRLRKDLPRWRNILATLSISIASFNSLLLLIIFLLPLTHFRLHVPGELFLSMFFSAPVGIALGFSLRGLPPLQTILAGAITIAVWFANVDFF